MLLVNELYYFDHSTCLEEFGGATLLQAFPVCSITLLRLTPVWWSPNDGRDIIWKHKFASHADVNQVEA